MSVSGFQPTTVNAAGLTSLIQNLGRDCSPTQFLREFVQNGIEACLRNKSKKNIVVVDYSEPILRKINSYKISFMDNGDGMSSDQMVMLLNSLSSSGTATAINYGVGAKISALTRNHAGILYQSWQGGKGNQIFISYNEVDRIYGIAGFESDGKTYFVIPTKDEDKPKEITTSGTVVTLFGMTEDQDTMLPPAGVVGSREAWIVYYLNSRFFQFPENVEVYSRIGYNRTNDSKHNYRAKIKGQRQVLDEQSESNGIIKLTDAKAYWWILKKGAQGHGRENVRGHSALINQNEVLDISDNRSNKLTYFGVYTGKDRVVIYIEPQDAVQNTARTGLLRKDGSPIDWSKWQDEFRDNMPVELKKYIDSILAENAGVSHLAKIEERLKEYSSLYKLGRYKPSKTGSLNADPDSVYDQQINSQLIPNTSSEVDLGLFNYAEKNKSTSGQNRRPSGGGFSSKLLSSLVDEEQLGIKAREISITPYPSVHWVQETTNENLIDRAAEYDFVTNTLLINKDFQGIKDVVDFWLKQFQESPENAKLITETAYEAFEQTLLECVVGALSFKNRKHWNHEDFLSAVSNEALSTAVMQRYWMMTQIKRILHSKLKQFALKQGSFEKDNDSI